MALNTQRDVSPPNTACVQNMRSAFLLMTTFLHLELRKWIYRVWETVKLLQCKSFCLGLRNQRIKHTWLNIISKLVLITYTILTIMYQLIDFHICNVSTSQSMKWAKQNKTLDFIIFSLHQILITIFTHGVFQMVIRK